MAMRIRAHYDGKNIIPEDPVDLPVNQSLEVELIVHHPKGRRPSARTVAWKRLLAGRVSEVRIPDEALRRESM